MTRVVILLGSIHICHFTCRLHQTSLRWGSEDVSLKLGLFDRRVRWRVVRNLIIMMLRMNVLVMIEFEIAVVLWTLIIVLLRRAVMHEWKGRGRWRRRKRRRVMVRAVMTVMVGRAYVV